MIKNPIIISYHESIPWKSGEQSLEELRGSELFNHPWIAVTVYYGEIKIKYNHSITALHASHSLASRQEGKWIVKTEGMKKERYLCVRERMKKSLL
jgi:hypothetical protein